MSVFISHSHKDDAIYSVLCSALDGRQIERWDYRTLTAGGSLQQQLRLAIANCSVCVLLATPRSLQSGWCLAEVGGFWGAGKPVIVYMSDASVSDEDIPPQFAETLRCREIEHLFTSISDHVIAQSKNRGGKRHSVVEQTVTSVIPREEVEIKWGEAVKEKLEAIRSAARDQQFEDALRISNDVIELAPTCWRAHSNRGVALVHLGRYAEANECFNFVCEEFTRNSRAVARALHNKAWLVGVRDGYSNQDSLVERLSLYQESLALDNSRIYTRALILICYSLLGRNDDAERFLRISLRWEGFVAALREELDELGAYGHSALASLPDWLRDFLYPQKTKPRTPNEYDEH